MKLLNFINKSLVVYKNHLWVSKTKYNAFINKFKNESREFFYELLVYMKNDDSQKIQIFVYFIIAIPIIEYIRVTFFNRDRGLMHVGRDLTLHVKDFQTNPVKDPIDSENYNKLHYAKEYTLKY